MRKMRVYFLTDVGMQKLRVSEAFSHLSLDQQDALEEFLFTSFGGENRVSASVFQSRLSAISPILALGEKEPLMRAIRSMVEVVIEAEPK